MLVEKDPGGDIVLIIIIYTCKQDVLRLIYIALIYHGEQILRSFPCYLIFIPDLLLNRYILLPKHQ